MCGDTRYACLSCRHIVEAALQQPPRIVCWLVVCLVRIVIILNECVHLLNQGDVVWLETCESTSFDQVAIGKKALLRQMPDLLSDVVAWTTLRGLILGHQEPLLWGGSLILLIFSRTRPAGLYPVHKAFLHLMGSFHTDQRRRYLLIQRAHIIHMQFGLVR